MNISALTEFYIYVNLFNFTMNLSILYPLTRFYVSFSLYTIRNSQYTLPHLPTVTHFHIYPPLHNYTIHPNHKYHSQFQQQQNRKKKDLCGYTSIIDTDKNGSHEKEEIEFHF